MSKKENAKTSSEDQQTATAAAAAKDDPKSRGSNRSRAPISTAFLEFMGRGWGERVGESPKRAEVADYLEHRHQLVGKAFPGERLVIPAGQYKVRSNDCDYRFRAHSAFAHLTGLGGEREPDMVLVLHPTDAGHTPVLYMKPRASRSSKEFFSDSRYGEFWVGARPTLEEVETELGIPCAHIDTLADALAKDAGQVQLRVIRGQDANVDALVAQVRQAAGLTDAEANASADAEFEAHCSTIRLCKDEWEVKQLQHAVDVTKTGFERVIRDLPRAVEHHRGERVIEGSFATSAREEGNGLGYDTIAAAGNHANTLHWIDNDGPVRAGELVLIDAGVEVDSLYTADITRTLPVNGKFTEPQARVYQAVLDAAEAALAQANKPGCRFREIHDAALEVIAKNLASWGMLPDTVENVLSPQGQQHRRWMPHGTSHHLGLDVHDCAQAKRELYLDAELEPGMCFTIEPGLYFRADDLMVPEELRGIGVRIEDDCIVRANGAVERLSEDIPRTIADVEAWMAEVQADATMATDAHPLLDAEDTTEAI